MPTIDVNGTTLFYDEQGLKDAPTLVLSHSFFFDREMFIHQIEELSKHIRVVTYDHRDQGKSARSELKSVDMDTLTDDAAAFIEALEQPEIVNKYIADFINKHSFNTSPY